MGQAAAMFDTRDTVWWTCAGCEENGGVSSAAHDVKYESSSLQPETSYPQESQHVTPPSVDHFNGRQSQSFAPPAIVANARSGIMIEPYCRKQRLVEEGGYEVARGCHIVFWTRVRQSQETQANKRDISAIIINACNHSATDTYLWTCCYRDSGWSAA
jgi:hypothetical protein